MVISTAEMGRVKKMEMLPCEIVSDWRSDISTRRPMTSASTIGAAGKSSFRIR